CVSCASCCWLALSRQASTATSRAGALPEVNKVTSKEIAACSSVTIAWLGSTSSQLHGRKLDETTPAGGAGARKVETTVPAGFGGTRIGGAGRATGGGTGAGCGSGAWPMNSLTPGAAKR